MLIILDNEAPFRGCVYMTTAKKCKGLAMTMSDGEGGTSFKTCSFRVVADRGDRSLPTS